MRLIWSKCVLALLWLLGGGVALADEAARSSINLPVGVTPISKEIYSLHMQVFWVCVAIAVAVFGAMAYSIFYHRKSRGYKAATFHESTAVEIAWTIVPFIILVVMAVPAAKTLIAMEDTRDSDMTIKITGYQWKWQYEYMDEGISFFSTLNAEHNKARQTGSGIDVTQYDDYLKDVDNPLVVPVGKKIRFLLTSADVIHAWWVQDLAVKKDAVPGFINENWALIEEPGIYRGKCAELCGRDHGFMPVVVKALPQDEYDAWVIEQTGGTATIASEEAVSAGNTAVVVAEAEVVAANDVSTTLSQEELMSRGKGVYTSNCIACHQAGGEGLPGAFPAITNSAVALGDINEHTKLVLNGVSGSAMAPFGAQLSDADIAAVITYQRNALGNSVGDNIQPTDVAALR